MFHILGILTCEADGGSEVYVDVCNVLALELPLHNGDDVELFGEDTLSLRVWQVDYRVQVASA